MERDLVLAFANLDKDDVLGIIDRDVRDGKDASLLLAGCRRGIMSVMEHYESRRYYLDSFVTAFDIDESARAVLDPLVPPGRKEAVGRMVIGTVEHDIHDIGKDMAASLLRGLGFEVFDVGANVPPARFVEELERTGATILGLSGLISGCFDSMRDTVAAVRRAGLGPKVIIGGGITDEALRKYVKADAHTHDMAQGARICLGFVKSTGEGKEARR